MLLKITSGSTPLKHNFPDNTTLHELLVFIEDHLSIADYEAELLIGYPPTYLDPLMKTENDLLFSLGIQSGMLVTVRVSEYRRLLYGNLSVMGFPRRIIRQAFQLISSYDLETCLEICQQLSEGDLLLSSTSPTGVKPSKIERKVIPADNSCLFRSIAYLLNPSHSRDPMIYRQMVADHVLSHVDSYPADFLDGKEAKEYAKWICQSEKWGGEIELSILAPLLAVEIAVVDIRTGKVYLYGEEENGTTTTKKRIYLLYDGVHYDALHRAVPLQTMFEPSDELTKEEAEGVAASLKESRQFVDLSAGQIMCQICQTVLGGQDLAVLHAKATGHQNFVMK
eukprot:gene7501-8298_t